MDPCTSIGGERIVYAEGEFGGFVGSASDDVVHGTYRTTGTWARALHNLLSTSLLRRGGTLIDVGANIGLISIPVAERCDVKTLAFEPDPRNAELLERNIALHGLEQKIAVHRLAAWSDRGTLPLVRHPCNHGDQRLERDEFPQSGESNFVTVPTAPLDALLNLADLPRPVVAKLDTQGAEVDVLLGARNALEEIDHLICEVWPAGLHRLGRTLDELVDLLAGAFPWGKLLLNGESVWPVPELRNEFARLVHVPDLDREDTFFDALVSRHRYFDP